MADETNVAVNIANNVENPFTANGELSQKADYIISHSTITRTEIHIEDPDKAASQETTIQVENMPQLASSPADVAASPPGKPEVASPQSIEVEVGKANAPPAEPQHAEEVRLKKKRCCSVQ